MCIYRIQSDTPFLRVRVSHLICSYLAETKINLIVSNWNCCSALVISFVSIKLFEENKCNHPRLETYKFKMAAIAASQSKTRWSFHCLREFERPARPWGLQLSSNILETHAKTWNYDLSNYLICVNTPFQCWKMAKWTRSVLNVLLTLYRGGEGGVKCVKN